MNFRITQTDITMYPYLAENEIIALRKTEKVINDLLVWMGKNHCTEIELDRSSDDPEDVFYLNMPEEELKAFMALLGHLICGLQIKAH